jgi:outer membrane lipoprotein-sorting protein
MPLKRLLATLAAVFVAALALAALAGAVSGGPTPPPKPLAQAIHDALAGPRPQGLVASVDFTNRLLEGANIVTGEEGESTSSNPLVAGGHGRLWIASDGDVRLELQSESGDTEVYWEHGTLSVYDVASHTVYTYTPAAGRERGATHRDATSAPSLKDVETALAQLERHAEVSAQPADVAGRPAYTVRLDPREKGSLLAGTELSFDAENGVPLRAAVYSTSSSSPVIELAAEGVAYESPPASVFKLRPPAGTKYVAVKSAGRRGAPRGAARHRPHVAVHGHGLTAVGELSLPAKRGDAGELSRLPSVSIGAAQARELKTALGTILTFEQGGVRYLLVGAVEPAAVQAVAREH